VLLAPRRVPIGSLQARAVPPPDRAIMAY